AVRVAPGAVMTAVIGPRSELVQSGRVGRLLDPSARRTPLYRLTLSPVVDSTTPPPHPRWRREGWSLRNEYPLALPDGSRIVHARIELRGYLPLLVRGVLVVLLDAAVLALLWFLGELISGARPPRLEWHSL